MAFWWVLPNKSMHSVLCLTVGFLKLDGYFMFYEVFIVLLTLNGRNFAIYLKIIGTQQKNFKPMSVPEIKLQVWV